MAPATPPPQTEDIDSLDQVFRALGDPTRRAIIAQLSSGDATMTQIAAQFDMSMPGISKHVSVLEGAGLVRKWRAGRSRYCQLQVDRMHAANDWITSQTTFWENTLDALASFMEQQEDEL